jgi:tetraacyldisaccharide 4'-kinase
MLARALAGVPVLVAADRHAAGLEAERRFNPSVHLLDDGFQHLTLARDVDLLLIAEDDLADRVLPAGRLRESLDAATAADAVLVSSGDPQMAVRIGRAVDVETAFTVTRRAGPARWMAAGRGDPVPAGATVIAVAGIARPERFFRDASDAGLRIVEKMVFADHHPFTAADRDRITAIASRTGADLVLTTEKDAVRLDGWAGPPVAVLPLTLEIDPPSFADWILARIQTARQSIHVASS